MAMGWSYSQPKQQQMVENANTEATQGIKEKHWKTSKRWLDDIKKTPSTLWYQKAQDRNAWKILEKAYLRQWTENG